MATLQKYVNRATREQVTAMKYDSIHDFPLLYEFVKDIYPTITPAHTRIYEGNWIVRTSNNTIEYICCDHGENCFDNKYTLYK